MKLKYSLIALCLMVSAFISPRVFSQTRLPDGTIINRDGSKHLPNGTTVYPDGTIIWKDGSRHYPKGAKPNTGDKTINGILYPNNNYPVYNKKHSGRNNNGQWLPPGQAKKRYGGEAKDYAPGHNKGRGNWNRGNEDNENDQGERGHGKGHDKGHGHGDREKDD